MVPEWSRRTILRAGMASTVGLLAGCTQQSQEGPWLRTKQGGLDDERSTAGPGTAGSPTAVDGDGGTSGPDPDAGRDSYGIVFRNETDKETTITGEVRLPWEEKQVWLREVEMPGESTKSWDSVLTKEAEHAVIGRVPIPEHQGGRFDKEEETSNLWITPGAEDAPNVANLVIRVFEQIAEENVETHIDVTYRGE